MRSRNTPRLACHRDYFCAVATEQQAYVLGFFAADGSVSASDVRLCLAAKDKEHLLKIRSLLGSAHAVNEYTDPKGHCTVVWAATSEELVRDLTRNGVGPRKTHTLRWPEHLSDEMLRHFLRGYFDGDGSAYSYIPKGYITPQVRLTFSGNETFLTGCRAFLQRTCGVGDVKIINHAPVKASTLGFGGSRQVRRIAETLYSGATVWLERKRRILEPNN